MESTGWQAKTFAASLRCWAPRWRDDRVVEEPRRRASLQDREGTPPPPFSTKRCLPFAAGCGFLLSDARSPGVSSEEITSRQGLKFRLQLVLVTFLHRRQRQWFRVIPKR